MFFLFLQWLVIAACIRDCKGTEESKVLCTQVFVMEPMLASLGNFNYRRIISCVLDLHSAGYIIQERECTAGIYLEVERSSFTIIY